MGNDITFIRMQHGFVYLVAIMDWYSRYVLSWQLSVTLDVSFCLAALEWALKIGHPEIFNSDQGSQFTSAEFTGRLNHHGIVISMDGRGRAIDNVFVERLWRTVKYEEVYLKDYEHVPEAIENLKNYFRFYNGEADSRRTRLLHAGRDLLPSRGMNTKTRCPWLGPRSDRAYSRSWREFFVADGR